MKTNVAFIIGCEEYIDNNLPNLPGVRQDIKLIKQALVENCGCNLEDVFISADCIYSGKAVHEQTAVSAVSVLRFLAQKAKDYKKTDIENLFFYFSGHGFLSQNNEVCLLLRDSLVEPVQSGILTQEQITKTLKAFRSVKHIIIILDMCLNEMLSKGMKERTINCDYFPKGTIIFFSCFPREKSYMIPKHLHRDNDDAGSGSLFTSCFVESLKKLKRNSTVNDVSRFLKERMSEISNELGINQKPFTQLQDTTLGSVQLKKKPDNVRSKSCNGLKNSSNKNQNRPTILDIYVGELDAKREVKNIKGGEQKFLDSFIAPANFPFDDFIEGKKFLIRGDKGVGKTSIIFYLRRKVEERYKGRCYTSFIFFKDESTRRMNQMEDMARALITIVDVSGIEYEDLDYRYIWKWMIFKKIVDDAKDATKSYYTFRQDNKWKEFVHCVNEISCNVRGRRYRLGSLKVSPEFTQSSQGVNSDAELDVNQDNINRAYELMEALDTCEQLFKRLRRTAVPYYIFVDEMEAFRTRPELFMRDLTMIRDLIRAIDSINSYDLSDTKAKGYNGDGRIHIIAAVRNELLTEMQDHISPHELNKITDNQISLKWSHNNKLKEKHPIIQILMRRISMACGGEKQSFYDWFPLRYKKQSTIQYILDLGWSKPRDIVRFLSAAYKNYEQCSGQSFFSSAILDALERDYSKDCLSEIRQELEPFFEIKEISMLIDMFRGSNRFLKPNEIVAMTKEGSPERRLWEEQEKKILQVFYRVGFWGCVKRTDGNLMWNWYHKDSPKVMVDKGWFLVIHRAFMKTLKLTDNREKLKASHFDCI